MKRFEEFMFYNKPLMFHDFINHFTYMAAANP